MNSFIPTNFTPFLICFFFFHHFSVSFQSFFSQLSIRFVVCLQAKKGTRFIFTAGRQNFPTRFWVGKEREKGSTHDWHREVEKSRNLRHLLSRIWRKNYFREHKLSRFWGFKSFRELKLSRIRQIRKNISKRNFQ